MRLNNKDTSNRVADAKAANTNRINSGTFENGIVNQGSSIETQNIYNNYGIKDSNKSEKDDIGFVITEGADITPTPYFTGREKELKDLREHIYSMNKLVLVSGIGGIGKTHLCRYLYREYIKSYNAGRETEIDHIGYLNYYGSMDDTLANGLKFNKSGNSEEDVASAWCRLEDLANSTRLLVIVDNVTHGMDKDESIKKLYNLTCAVVLTSRLSGFERFKTLPIGVLPLDECRDIFDEIYGDIDASEQTDLDYILSDLAAMHTKTVELLASIAHDKGWKVTRLRQELMAKRFNLTFTSEGNETTLQTEYEKLFDLSGLTEKEVNVLEAFSIMPPLPITTEICNSFFNEDAGLTEGNEIFNTLHRKGCCSVMQTAFQCTRLLLKPYSINNGL
ncbi:MAG TPA: ATP-binding protein [Clostridia bacterium]|nr:ATP-binding protein [Clostridia bacterium]